MVEEASAEAQQILDHAVNDANDIRLGAMQYTDEILANLQNIITHSMENITIKYESFMKSLNNSLEIVIANRNELIPPQEEQSTEQVQTEENVQQDSNGTEFEDYTVDLS